jgi:hypothetical protein
VEYFSRCGIYRGFVPFDQLRKELFLADAFLTVMSFQPADRVFVETSFTTKWLDYAPLGKPIFVWGPAYCSAARFARETRASVVVDNPEPQCLARAIEKVANNSTCWGNAGRAIAKVAAQELSAERLHGVLRQKLEELVAGNHSAFRKNG